MKKSKRMAPVAGVAEQRERDAARRLGDAQKRLAESEAKLAELGNYRNEYARAFEADGSHGLDARRLREYRHFLDRLNTAIDEQARRVAQCQADVDVQRRAWVETRMRSQVLEKVVDRYRRDEHLAQERRDQLEADERNQRPSADWKPRRD